MLFSHCLGEGVQTRSFRHETERHKWCLEEGLWTGVHEVEVVELSTAPSNCSSVNGCYQHLGEIDQDFAEEAACFDFLLDGWALAGGVGGLCRRSSAFLSRFCGSELAGGALLNLSLVVWISTALRVTHCTTTLMSRSSLAQINAVAKSLYCWIVKALDILG